jgi:biopolymer transport protein ExbD
MIDVLLVILIFLMITTTYSKFSGLEINLPTADAPQNKEQPNEINVVVTAAGEVLVNKATVAGRDIASIANAMRRVAGTEKEPVVIINADAKAAHQSVIDVMQAAQQAGLSHISFATQQAQR